ncbi:HAD family hydrolase [Bacillus daqingensis]|uniref:HAD family hydrolase n=1 Tax=Bacillus daqingensis TaxID=872396 RepID=A0ABV9NR86_9BACI
MTAIKAILFDLDDTLLSRKEALHRFFLLVVEKGYVEPAEEDAMWQAFQEEDAKWHGHADKTDVLRIFFERYPPGDYFDDQEYQQFWNDYFPSCYAVTDEVVDMLDTLKQQVHTGIVTNGVTKRQQAKLSVSKLERLVDEVVISEEAGVEKPDARIFQLALSRLNVQPHEAVFVGDDLKKDIAGSQSAGMRAVWYNPERLNNDTAINPDNEVQTWNELLRKMT